MNRREFLRGMVGAAAYSTPEHNTDNELLEAQGRLLRVSLRMLFDLYKVGGDQLGIEIDEKTFGHRLQQGIQNDIEGKNVWDDDFWEHDLEDFLPGQNFEESSGGEI